MINRPKVRHKSTEKNKSLNKKPMTAGVKRALIALVLFLFLAAISDIQVWLIEIPFDARDSDRWIIAPFKSISIFVMSILFLIFAIFNVGFNLVLSLKSGSIALIHFFMIGIVISFSIFAGSEWEEKRGCIQENLSIACWVKNSVTSMEKFLEGSWYYENVNF